MIETNQPQNEVLVLQEKIALLEEKVKKLTALNEYYLTLLQLNAQKKYGSSTEQTDSMQMSMFNEAENESDLTCEEPSATEVITYKRKKRKGKREEDFSKLETETVEHNLEEKVCSECGSENIKVIIETFKEVTIVPAQIKVTEHKTETCKCNECKKEVKPVDTPNKLLPKCVLSPSLAAYIAVSKYAQAQPLDRIAKGFDMLGINISKQNMCNWLIKLSLILHMIVEIFIDYMKTENFIHGDETTVQVHGEDNRSNNQKSYMWVFVTGEYDVYDIAVYRYRDNRRMENPVSVLGDYSGYFHCDGYSGYNGLGAKLCGCWAHARRKYADILKIKALCVGDAETAKKGFEYCNKIFELERKFKNLPYDERKQKRIEKTKPILDEYFEWVNGELSKVSAKSMLYTALFYSQNQRDKLLRFLEDGRIEVSNNRAERVIRPFTIGRKNWLFSDSPRGAETSANFYSVIETAKLNNLNPYEYLKYIFEYFRTHGKTIYNEKNELAYLPGENFDISEVMPWANILPDIVKL